MFMRMFLYGMILICTQGSYEGHVRGQKFTAVNFL